MKVIIAGGRDFEDYDLLCSKLDIILQNVNGVEIVCGMAKGADTLGLMYARERKLPVKEFPPKYPIYGPRLAPIIRNKHMAKYADALVLFWDGVSRGSKNMKMQAEEQDLKIRVIKY